MKKIFLSILSFISILSFSIFTVACSDRGTATEPEDQPADNNVVTVTDIDGNVYPTVKIGSQLWMAENLRVIHYRNGEAITSVKGGQVWQLHLTEGYCTYGDSVENTATYGLLYNWHAVTDKRNLAPTGWHVPSDTEWQILIDFLGGSSIAGGEMKDSGGWFNNGNGSNSSEFTALPGGICYSNGIFNGIGFSASFWSSTGYSSDGAWNRLLSYVSPGIGRDGGNKLDGISVRCVRD
jgi:uncharacterized protein (TIGR02145 family)